MPYVLRYFITVILQKGLTLEMLPVMVYYIHAGIKFLIFIICYMATACGFCEGTQCCNMRIQKIWNGTSNIILKETLD